MRSAPIRFSRHSERRWTPNGTLPRGRARPLKLDPAREEAFTFLRDAYGARNSDWERVIALAEELADRSSLGNGATHLLTQAGLLAWKERGDLIRARRSFERLAGVAPTHPALKAFEAQIGETLSAAVAARQESDPPPRSKKSKGKKSAAAAPEPEPDSEPSAALAEPPTAPPPPDPPTGRPRAPEPEAPAAPARAQDAKLVKELRDKLAQQESAKRYHEYVKTLIALGDALAEPRATGLSDHERHQRRRERGARPAEGEA
jgi:hypothetical protein